VAKRRNEHSVSAGRQLRGPDDEGGHGDEGGGARPRRAAGVELIGRYEDSGFKEPPYLVRRHDGQVIQLPELLYAIAEGADGSRDYAALGDSVKARLGVLLKPQDVAFLVEKRLRPLGVLENPNAMTPSLERVDPMLALKLRVAVVPAVVVRALAYVLKPLFLPLVVAGMLAGLVAVDVWLFALHGIAQSVRTALYDPLTLFLVLGLLATSAGFHECGHAAACRYGGARPGAMGVGLYLVWPAFYTDVTDAYRLGRRGRLRTDLGGIYFNAIFIVATAIAYQGTHVEPLLLFIAVQHIEMFHQLLPFLRLDGYYIVSDLVGVPDMFSRIRPTLASLVPGRRADERVRALKPWARGVVTAYVFTVVPILVLLFGLMTLSAPRVFATAWDSLSVHYEQTSSALEQGETLIGVAGSVQMGALALPAAGMAASFGRVGKKALDGAWKLVAGRPMGRAELVLAMAALAGWAAFIWWPNGNYVAIRATERGTVQGAIGQVRALVSGGRKISADRGRAKAPTEVAASRNVPERDGPAPASGAGKSPQSGTSSRAPMARGQTTIPCDEASTTTTSDSTTTTSASTTSTDTTTTSTAMDTSTTTTPDATTSGTSCGTSTTNTASTTTNGTTTEATTDTSSTTTDTSSTTTDTSSTTTDTSSTTKAGTSTASTTNP
jgi:putative peptide zinc metalloprotease protein